MDVSVNLDMHVMIQEFVSKSKNVQLFNVKIFFCIIKTINKNLLAICKKSFESYTDCGTACPKTCDNIGETNMFCTFQCVQGCFCEEGYVRNAQGDCVVVEECPQREFRV